MSAPHEGSARPGGTTSPDKEKTPVALERNEGRDNHLAAGVTLNTTRLPHQDLLDELDAINTAWIAGYETGRSHGMTAHLDDLEAAASHREAAEVVRRVADFPERDRAADRVAAERRAAAFGQPRFGGAA